MDKIHCPRRNIPESLSSTQQAESTTTVSSTIVAPEAERRQLTVMFCDLQGSTALSQRLIDIRRWHAEGHGYRRIARLLEDLGVFTTRSSIHRLLKGLALYPKKSTKNTVQHGK